MTVVDAEDDGATPEPDRIALIVLAAGAGSRMRSALPKPLHPVAGLPMLRWVLAAGASVAPTAQIVVAGPGLTNSAAWRAAGIPADTVVQDPPLGTADATAAALRRIPAVDWLLVLFADHPLLTSTTVHALVNQARSTRALVTLLTCRPPDPAGYARIARDGNGRLTHVVERNDDDLANRPSGIEVNSGMMVVDARWAERALTAIPKSPVTGEYYLTDLVRLAVAERAAATDWPVQSVLGVAEELLGINDRVELASADLILRRRIREQHMRNGVTMILPDTISIAGDVTIGADTTIHPYSIIDAGTTIGKRCSIGPHAMIANSRLGDEVMVRASTIVDSTMEAGSDAGPYAHLRGGTSLGTGVHVGNFAEIKNASLGEDARAGHMSYLGDATIGARVNIGAGTVTCNYDGVDKHRTTIGDDAFIGSDTMLVAPVTIGDAARTGAGAVVTNDVGPGETVFGVPAKPKR